jgi:ribosomal protein S19E (S16A)
MRTSSKIIGLINLAYGGGDHCNKHVLWELEEDGLATKDCRPDQKLTDKGVTVLSELLNTYDEQVEPKQ